MDKLRTSNCNIPTEPSAFVRYWTWKICHPNGQKNCTIFWNIPPCNKFLNNTYSNVTILYVVHVFWTLKSERTLKCEVHNTRFVLSVPSFTVPWNVAGVFCSYPSSMLFLLVILNLLQPEAQAFGFKSDSHLCACEAVGGTTWCFTYDISCGSPALQSCSGFSAVKQECCPVSASSSHNLQEFQIHLKGITTKFQLWSPPLPCCRTLRSVFIEH